MDLLIGADLRKYRKAIQKSQQEFAKRMGISQATLSLIEVGKLPLSTAHLGRLEKEFNKPAYTPKFKDFVSKIEEQRRTGQALVGHPEAGFMTVPVYEWEENFDLSAAPASLGVKGMVTVRSATPEIIAFEMPSGSVWWVEKETLVFAKIFQS